MARSIYKWHKWLAVGAAVFTVLWFISGIVMALPTRIWPRDGAPVLPASSSPSYKDIRVSIPEAIAAAEAAAGQPIEVTGVTTQRILGRIIYQISTTRQGSHMVDAADATRFQVSPEVAAQLAAAAARNSPRLEEPVLMDAGRGKKAYRIAADDGRVFLVATEDGEVRTLTRAGRARGMISGWHTFSFLEPILGAAGTRVFLILSSIVGTAMSFFGVWILWIQFQQWRRARYTINANQ